MSKIYRFTAIEDCEKQIRREAEKGKRYGARVVLLLKQKDEPHHFSNVWKVANNFFYTTLHAYGGNLNNSQDALVGVFPVDVKRGMYGLFYATQNTKKEKCYDFCLAFNNSTEVYPLVVPSAKNYNEAIKFLPKVINFAKGYEPPVLNNEKQF